MRIDKILNKINELEKGISQLRDLLYSPEGIRVTAILKNNLIYVEYWDGDSAPIILFLDNETINDANKKVFFNYVNQALNLIPISAVQRDDLEFITNLKEEDLDVGAQIGIDIFKMKIKSYDEYFLKTLRSRHDFNYYLSRIKETQNNT